MADEDYINIKVKLEDVQKFVADNEKSSDAIEKNEKAVDGVDKSSKKASSSLGMYNKNMGVAGKVTTTTTGLMKRAATTAIGLGAAYLGIGAAKDAVDTTVQLGTATIALNRNLGLSVNTASQWAAVAKSRNVDAKALNQSFLSLSKNQVASEKATNKSGNAFAKLGITQKELKNLDFNELLYRTADGLKEMGSGADRTALSGKLFGKGWQSVAPVLRDGSKAMKEQLALATKYGATFEGKSIKNVKDYVKAQRESKFAMMGLQLTIGTTLIPWLTKLFSFMAKLVNQMREGKGVFGLVKTALEDLAGAAKSVVDWTKKHETAARVIGGVLLSVITALHAVSAAQWAYNRAVTASKAITWLWTKEVKGATIASRIWSGVLKVLNGIMWLSNKAALATRVQVGLLVVQEKAQALWAGRAAIATKAWAFATATAGKAVKITRIQTVLMWVATKALAIASAVVTGATKAWTAAQWLLNVALNANPISLIIIGIAALVAAFVVAYTKVKWFRDGVNSVVNFIKNHWKLILFPVAPFVAIVILIIKNWKKIKKAAVDVKNWIVGAWNDTISFFKGIPGKIAKIAKGMWDGIKTAFKDAINWVIDRWNDLPDLKIGGGDILGVGIPEVGVSIPNIDRIGGGSGSKKGKKKSAGSWGGDAVKKAKGKKSSVSAKTSMYSPVPAFAGAGAGGEDTHVQVNIDGESFMKVVAKKHRKTIASAVNDVARDKKARM